MTGKSGGSQRPARGKVKPASQPSGPKPRASSSISLHSGPAANAMDTEYSATNKRKLQSPSSSAATGPTAKKTHGLLNPVDRATAQHSTSTESLTSLASVCSGVLSDSCIPCAQSESAGTSVRDVAGKASVLPTNPPQPLASLDLTAQPSQQAARPQPARINLNSPEITSNLPPDTRQVFLTSTDPAHNLAKLNPFRIAQELDGCCGAVARVSHKASGSLLITTNTLQQVHTLLCLTHFSASKIPVRATVAWESQLSHVKPLRTL